ncbi:S9 family peptidase [Cytophagales bacterium RKSG123]|nr:S9 family peptidase [Xanthovirga aplysinae]
MKGEKFIGYSPKNIRWATDSQKVFFDWNPDQNPGDSLYSISPNSEQLQKVKPEERRKLPSFSGVFNQGKTQRVYVKNGDLFLQNMEDGSVHQLTNTLAQASFPSFSGDNKKIIFTMKGNLFSLEKSSGLISQLTDFRSGKEHKTAGKITNKHDKWLYDDQLENFEILNERHQNKELAKKQNKRDHAKRPKKIFIGNKRVSQIQLSPDEKFITYRLTQKNPETKNTIVPDYVTETGYTKDLNVRTKVGNEGAFYETAIYNIEKDTTYLIQTAKIPGIRDIPKYLWSDNQGNGPKSKKESKRVPQAEKDRNVVIHGPFWSENGNTAVIIVRALDNKDRWIMKLDPNTGEPSLLDRQHDDAWIAGPGISWSFSAGSVGWMPDNINFWFQSEESGYSHLYTVNVHSGKKTTLTKGEFEIYNPFISKDKKFWYFEANKSDPEIRHFYKMPLNGGKITQLTSMNGGNEVALSPDEKWLAIRHSTANQPWELYIQENKTGAKARKITSSQTEDFKAYTWRKPEFVTFEARDGAQVHARLYKPESAENNGPAIIFVHGAGYLQNAHQWWSSYFREYMFHNLLVDNGYTVLDIDYRGSAGYGRDWRTGIYRHMGGNDLNDQVDGAKWLVETQNIDPNRLGIYGGSYGGFITLMAMFTEPGVFQAGAALRSVTDWAHYNHPYTSNILNTPITDSLAYRKSSPIYFADGLSGALLIAHGMVDTNVHFQDVVRLSQRLIELGKENWELAVYPMENHGFKEASSWTDEYRRIFKLFEENLKKNNL